MEVEHNKPNNGLAGTALGLGAGALGLTLLPGLSNILGINGGEVHDLLIERNGEKIFLDDFSMLKAEFPNEEYWLELEDVFEALIAFWKREAEDNPNIFYEN